MNSHPLLQNLNDKQAEAVTSIEGPVLVLAGAGSGKTKVLTHRIAYLIDQGKASPEQILAVTFTNKAANEIKERISHLLAAKGGNIALPWAGTFHSICVKILKRDGENIGISRGFTIYDPDDQQRAVKEAMKNLNIDTKDFSPRGVLNLISAAKNELIKPATYKNLAEGYFQQTVAQIYPEYQKILKENQALDFDDLIMRTIDLFRESPHTLNKYQTLFNYVMVDEYQDTNHAQYVLVHLLAEKYKNIFVVGDDAQSIYRWRGATIKNILNFENDYENVKTIKLEQNYRSTQTILSASNQIISLNLNQKPKELWTQNPGGEQITIYQARDEWEEARFIAENIEKLDGKYDSCAILYRTNAQSRVLEEVMIEYGLPYRLIGAVRFYDRREIKDILAYLRLVLNPADNLSFKRIINTPRRGIGDSTVKKIAEISRMQGKPMMEAMRNLNDFMQTGYLTGAIVNKLLPLNTLLENLSLALETKELVEYIQFVVEETKLIDELNDGSFENQERIENIKEFVSIASKYKGVKAVDSLPDFLEEIALLEDQAKKARDEQEDKSVVLMTLHSAKGLEFDYVFIAGLEEGLFPHSNSFADIEQMEEERRLAYVGITRAKKKLYLTYTTTRTIFGKTQSTIVSRFIKDLPEEVVETINVDIDLGSSWKEVGDDFDEEYKIDLKQGDKVRHQYFGTGTVLGFNDEIITVKFDTKGTKELALEYANLVKV